ncbi:hypothetical protein [Actinoplanes sp. NPDC051851]|uniref:hypothetical protein n=1 Tax=Actinoplanes sp. NPDC051851 TaxID=3154753 RepID=UPI00342E8E18
MTMTGDHAPRPAEDSRERWLRWVLLPEQLRWVPFPRTPADHDAVRAGSGLAGGLTGEQLDVLASWWLRLPAETPAARSMLGALGSVAEAPEGTPLHLLGELAAGRLERTIAVVTVDGTVAHFQRPGGFEDPAVVLVQVGDGFVAAERIPEAERFVTPGRPARAGEFLPVWWLNQGGPERAVRVGDLGEQDLTRLGDFLVRYGGGPAADVDAWALRELAGRTTGRVAQVTGVPEDLEPGSRLRLTRSGETFAALVLDGGAFRLYARDEIRQLSGDEFRRFFGAPGRTVVQTAGPVDVARPGATEPAPVNESLAPRMLPVPIQRELARRAAGTAPQDFSWGEWGQIAGLHGVSTARAEEFADAVVRGWPDRNLADRVRAEVVAAYGRVGERDTTRELISPGLRVGAVLVTIDVGDLADARHRLASEVERVSLGSVAHAPFDHYYASRRITSGGLANGRSLTLPGTTVAIDGLYIKGVPIVVIAGLPLTGGSSQSVYASSAREAMTWRQLYHTGTLSYFASPGASVRVLDAARAELHRQPAELVLSFPIDDAPLVSRPPRTGPLIALPDGATRQQRDAFAQAMWHTYFTPAGFPRPTALIDRVTAMAPQVAGEVHDLLRERMLLAVAQEVFGPAWLPRDLKPSVTSDRSVALEVQAVPYAVQEVNQQAYYFQLDRRNLQMLGSGGGSGGSFGGSVMGKVALDLRTKRVNVAPLTVAGGLFRSTARGPENYHGAGAWYWLAEQQEKSRLYEFSTNLTIRLDSSLPLTLAPGQEPVVTGRVVTYFQVSQHDIARFEHLLRTAVADGIVARPQSDSGPLRHPPAFLSQGIGASQPDVVSASSRLAPAVWRAMRDEGVIGSGQAFKREVWTTYGPAQVLSDISALRSDKGLPMAALHRIGDDRWELVNAVVHLHNGTDRPAANRRERERSDHYPISYTGHGFGQHLAPGVAGRVREDVSVNYGDDGKNYGERGQYDYSRTTGRDLGVYSNAWRTNGWIYDGAHWAFTYDGRFSIAVQRTVIVGLPTGGVVTGLLKAGTVAAVNLAARLGREQETPPAGPAAPVILPTDVRYHVAEPLTSATPVATPPRPGALVRVVREPRPPGGTRLEKRSGYRVHRAPLRETELGPRSAYDTRDLFVEAYRFDELEKQIWRMARSAKVDPMAVGAFHVRMFNQEFTVELLRGQDRTRYVIHEGGILADKEITAALRLTLHGAAPEPGVAPITLQPLIGADSEPSIGGAVTRSRAHNLMLKAGEFGGPSGPDGGMSGGAGFTRTISARSLGEALSSTPMMGVWLVQEAWPYRMYKATARWDITLQHRFVNLVGGTPIQLAMSQMVVEPGVRFFRPEPRALPAAPPDGVPAVLHRDQIRPFAGTEDILLARPDTLTAPALRLLNQHARFALGKDWELVNVDGTPRLAQQRALPEALEALISRDVLVGEGTTLGSTGLGYRAAKEVPTGVRLALLILKGTRDPDGEGFAYRYTGSGEQAARYRVLFASQVQRAVKTSTAGYRLWSNPYGSAGGTEVDQFNQGGADRSNAYMTGEGELRTVRVFMFPKADRNHHYGAPMDVEFRLYTAFLPSATLTSLTLGGANLITNALEGPADARNPVAVENARVTEHVMIPDQVVPRDGDRRPEARFVPRAWPAAGGTIDAVLGAMNVVPFPLTPEDVARQNVSMPLPVAAPLGEAYEWVQAAAVGALPDRRLDSHAVKRLLSWQGSASDALRAVLTPASVSLHLDRLVGRDGFDVADLWVNGKAFTDNRGELQMWVRAYDALPRGHLTASVAGEHLTSRLLLGSNANSEHAGAFAGAGPQMQTGNDQVVDQVYVTPQADRSVSHSRGTRERLQHDDTRRWVDQNYHLVDASLLVAIRISASNERRALRVPENWPGPVFTWMRGGHTYALFSLERGLDMAVHPQKAVEARLADPAGQLLPRGIRMPLFSGDVAADVARTRAAYSMPTFDGWQTFSVDAYDPVTRTVSRSVTREAGGRPRTGTETMTEKELLDWFARHRSRRDEPLILTGRAPAERFVERFGHGVVASMDDVVHDRENRLRAARVGHRMDGTVEIKPSTWVYHAPDGSKVPLGADLATAIATMVPPHLRRAAQEPPGASRPPEPIIWSAAAPSASTADRATPVPSTSAPVPPGTSVPVPPGMSVPVAPGTSVPASSAPVPDPSVPVPNPFSAAARRQSEVAPSGSQQARPAQPASPPSAGGGPAVTPQRG